jgi:hypothetical protein
MKMKSSNVIDLKIAESDHKVIRKYVKINKISIKFIKNKNNSSSFFHLKQNFHFQMS